MVELLERFIRHPEAALVAQNFGLRLAEFQGDALDLVGQPLDLLEVEIQTDDLADDLRAFLLDFILQGGTDLRAQTLFPKAASGPRHALFCGHDKFDDVLHLLAHARQFLIGFAPARHQLFGSHLLLGEEALPVAEFSQGDGVFQDNQL